jgi:heme/copper-type cytochrome/quinol oxidase subunit 3
MSATTHSSEFHVHQDSDAARGRRERLGVRLLIVADGSFLFSMIFSYFYLRNLNNNNAWLPKGVNHYSVGSAWLVAFPFIVAAITHRLGQSSRQTRGLTSIVTVVVIAVGMYYQYHQMAHMPFMLRLDNGVLIFNGAYATNWVLIAGAGMFHYILSLFIGLGILIRTKTTHVSEELELWRQRVAQSWFTWCAIAAILTAITLSIV